MPVKRLPKKLVKRLRAAAPKLETALGKMKNLDHRRINLWNNELEIKCALVPGTRVREMNVSRNFPKTKLALKRVHESTAAETIKKICSLVRQHNSKHKPKNYTLVPPKAYAISSDLIAMAKTGAPSMMEIMDEKTPRAERMVEELRSKHGLGKSKLVSYAGKICGSTGWTYSHVLLLGANKGKPVFMPLLDLD